MTIDNERLKELDLTDSTSHNNYSLLNKVQHRYSPLRRMRECMTKPIPDSHNNIVLKTSDKRGTKFIGLERCKSRWCPVCNKIEVAVQQTLMTMRHLQMIKNGYIPFFITLTQPRNSDIETSNKNMGKYLNIWKRALEHKYSELKAKYMVSSKDFTFDLIRPNAIYHLHYHNLLYIPKEMFETTKEKIHSLKALNSLSEASNNKSGVLSKIESFKAVCKQVWTRITGYKATEKGQNIQVAKNNDITTYIKKIESASNITYEVVSKAKTKTHNKDTITWVGLLEHIANKPNDKKAIAIYRHFLTAMKRKKLLNWGQGLKKLLIDEDIKEEVNNEILEKNEEMNKTERTKSFRISTALMRMIGKLRIQGTLCSMLDSSWNGDNIYSLNMFETLVSKANEHIENPTTIIKEMIELKIYILVMAQAWKEDGLINDKRYATIQQQLY